MNDEQKAAVRHRYERAVATLTDILQRDRTILAAILGGSLAYDEVWEKSDIDLLIIGDETHKTNQFTLIEEDINIHAAVMPRSAFKKTIEGSLQSSFFHSYISKSRLLYTHDESLHGLYENIQKVGSRDRAAQLLRSVSSVLWALPKAEKWLTVKQDLHYSFYYILLCANSLAMLEVVAAGQIASREVLQHALTLNPRFFQQVYKELIDGPKDAHTLATALTAIHQYLDERTYIFLQPLLDYLAEAGGPRSASEIDAEFRKMVQGESISLVCEWLSEKGIIEKVPLPLRLSPKSQVAVNEAGYYYDGGK
jgi:predicted nucleotidyltransferase